MAELDASREVVGTSVEWMVLAPREPVKVRPWCGMASRQNWKDRETDDLNTDRVEYEPSTDYGGCAVDPWRGSGGRACGSGWGGQ